MHGMHGMRGMYEMHLAEDRRCPVVARGPPVVKQVATLHGIKASYAFIRIHTHSYAFIRIQRIHLELVTSSDQEYGVLESTCR